MAQKLGPYATLAGAQSVARVFVNLGETVRIEETYEPYRSTPYRAFVIRGESE